MKEEIVKRFLEEGVLLTPDALGKITESNLQAALDKAVQSKSAVFSFHADGQQPAITIEVRKLQKKVKLSPQDFAKHYNAMFEGLRGMLQKKMEDAVSVANAKKSGSSISTIGMVREQTQRGFIIEDTTGNAEVISKSEDVGIDDVIGVKAGVKEERLFAEEIIWPDIPMSRKHSRPEMEIILADKKKEGGEAAFCSESGCEGEIVITPEAVYADRKKTSLPNPGWITITKDGANVTILVYRPDKPASQKEVLTWLRKRHISPDKNQVRGTDDPFLIEPIPDLVWIISGEQWVEMYKSVIVVSSDGKVPADVDLATGKVKFEK